MFSRPRPTSLSTPPALVVIDSDRTFRHFALRVARRLGCAGVGLHDAEEALVWFSRHAFEEAPAVITIDAKLRAMNGYTLCQRLRALPQTRHVPIVFASSRTELEDNILALEAGADEFLPKPVHSQLYIDTIERYLTIGRLNEITIEVTLDLHVDVMTT